jgi:hypothetical protein
MVFMVDEQQISKPPQDTSSHAKRDSMRSEVAIELAGAAGSLMAGAVTAWRLVMERSHSNLSTLGIFRDLKPKRDKWGEEHVAAMEGMPREESAKLIRQASAKYQSQLSTRLDAAGYKTFSERLDILHSFQKWEVAITSLAVTGVALGSIVYVAKTLFGNQQPEKEASPEKTLPKEPEQLLPAPRPESFVEAEKQRAAASNLAPSLTA